MVEIIKWNGIGKKSKSIKMSILLFVETIILFVSDTVVIMAFNDHVYLKLNTITSLIMHPHGGSSSNIVCTEHYD